MKKYKFYVSLRGVGCNMMETFEFGDNVTNEELEQAYQVWVRKKITMGLEIRTDDKTN